MLLKNTRIEITDNTGLSFAVGTQATVVIDEPGNDLLCMVDGESTTTCLPLDQCSVIS